MEKARKAPYTHLLPIAAVTMGQKGKEIVDLPALKEAGICAISEDGRSVTDGGLMKEAMRRCKALDIPILIVTARQEDIDKIKGLGMGADDYITKPFSPNVLVARIKANLAQYDRLKREGACATAQLRMGNILIQEDARRVLVNGEEVKLKNKEYELLLFLMSNADIVFSKETLYERIWGLDALGDNATVAVHINRLREKIEEVPSEPRYIQTVWGVGYRFKP